MEKEAWYKEMANHRRQNRRRPWPEGSARRNWERGIRMKGVSREGADLEVVKTRKRVLLTMTLVFVQSLGEVYLVCLYFVCTVFTTVGFGVWALTFMDISDLLHFDWNGMNKSVRILHAMMKLSVQ
jgi:hypothetical protein